MKTYNEMLEYLKGLFVILNDDTLKIAVQTVGVMFNKTVDQVWQDMNITVRA